jgi:hypothetical protein
MVLTQWMTATYLMKWLQGQRCEATATTGIFRPMRTDRHELLLQIFHVFGLMYEDDFLRLFYLNT